MKKIITLLLAMTMVLGLAGCSSSGEKTDFDPIAEFGCDVLNVFNWGEYIGEDTINDFENKYNVRVNYTMFDSNEEMYTKLLGGDSYDILVPSDYMIERLINENMLQKLDLSLIPNLDNLADGLKSPTYDPSHEYSIPYFWGSVGIIYDTTKVDPAKVEAMGWDILRDSEYAGDIFMYDSERDSFMVAFKALGYSMNTTDEAQINEAYEWLLDLHKTMNPAYVTDEVNDAMINSEKAMAVVYSGAASYIMMENEDMAYFEPNQGTNIWSDAMVIPANSKCPSLAHAWINFNLEPEVAEDNSITVGYTSGVQETLDELSKTEFDGINAYIPRSGFSKDEAFNDDEVLKKQLSELWIKVKMS